MREIDISVEINGKIINERVIPRMSLLDFIRERANLTGTHAGCEHGVCGACTIMINGEAARSCLMFAVQAVGAKIKTVEGLAKGEELHPLQKLFSEHRALQCGFCTPGMLMTAVDLVASNDALSELDIKVGMSAVLCRCTGYEGIIKAVIEYAEQVHGKPIAREKNIV